MTIHSIARRIFRPIVPACRLYMSTIPSKSCLSASNIATLSLSHLAHRVLHQGLTRPDMGFKCEPTLTVQEFHWLVQQKRHAIICKNSLQPRTLFSLQTHRTPGFCLLRNVASFDGQPWHMMSADHDLFSVAVMPEAQQYLEVQASPEEKCLFRQMQFAFTSTYQLRIPHMQFFVTRPPDQISGFMLAPLTQDNTLKTTHNTLLLQLVEDEPAIIVHTCISSNTIHAMLNRTLSQA